MVEVNSILAIKRRTFMKALSLCLVLTCLVLFGASFGMAESDAKELYMQCGGCHGTDGSHMALGTSAVLKGQTSDMILKKLNGYAEGTYGGSKKAVMTSIAKRLSEADRIKLAEYISKF